MLLIGLQLAVTVLTSVTVSHISVFVSQSVLLSIYGEWCVCGEGGGVTFG
jgi:Na+/serine symporter